MPIEDVFLPLVGQRHGSALAASVHVLMATEDETHTVLRSGTRFADHLREHGARASLEATKGSGNSIGKVLGSWANSRGAIVMGAYHHSRLNEILWGGVTKTVIGQPPCRVMISN